MTSRSDLSRVFAAVQVLGTEAETPTGDGRSKIALTWDTTQGWEYGPRKAPPQWEPGDDRCVDCGGTGLEPTDSDEEADQGPCERCGATGWLSGDLSTTPQAVVDDEKALEHKQRHRATEHHREVVETIAILDKATQAMFRLMDLAVPPNPAEMKNRRTGEYEPWTEAEIVLAGWCANCWMACQAWSPIPTDRKGYKKWKDRCGWCGPFRSAHGIDAPKELVVKHNEGHSISAAEVEEAVKKAKQAQSKGKKRRKGKQKAVAA